MWSPEEGITASILSQHMRCGWKTRWGTVLGYKPREAGRAASFGTRVHEMIEKLHRGERWRPERYESPEEVIAEAVVGSYARWATRAGRKYVAVEEEFAVRDEELGVLWRGKIDAIIEPDTIIDIKTRGTNRPLPDIDVRTYHPQTLVYMRAYELTKRRRARAMIYLYLPRPLLRQRQGESEEEFHDRLLREMPEIRAIQVHRPEDLEGALEKMVRRLKGDLERWEEVVRNVTACEELGFRCPYIDLCWRGDTTGLEVRGAFPELGEKDEREGAGDS